MQLKRNKEMEFETLKKSHKKQIIIGALAICIVGGALTFATTRAKYKLTEDLELAKGTINYKPYDFKIMAMYQQNDSGTYTEITTMPSSGYVINEEKTYCTTDNKTQVKGKIKTVNGIHGLYNINKNDKCYLYLDKKTSIDNASELLAKVQNEAKTGTPTFSNAATTDEGIYAVSDGMYGGTSYYWRGAVTNNYVKFANFCWRIIRINGDKTIRLIYDGTTCHTNGTNTAESIALTNVAYNSLDNQSNYVGWTYTGTSQRTTGGTASNAKAQLESWYSSNIGNNTTYSSKVADGKYCNDRNVQSGSTWAINGSTFYYAAYKRVITDKQPNLSCLAGDVYALKTGLITADEVMMAGDNGTYRANQLYYLYNGQHYWTMSPSYWEKESYSNPVMFCVKINFLGPVSVFNASIGLRPVINLKADITISSGNGTLNNPYIVQ